MLTSPKCILCKNFFTSVHFLQKIWTKRYHLLLQSIVFLRMLVKKNSQISHLSQKAYCISNPEKLSFKLVSFTTLQLLQRKKKTTQPNKPKATAKKQTKIPQTKQTPKTKPKQKLFTQHKQYNSKTSNSIKIIHVHLNRY